MRLLLPLLLLLKRLLMLLRRLLLLRLLGLFLDPHSPCPHHSLLLRCLCGCLAAAVVAAVEVPPVRPLRG